VVSLIYNSIRPTCVLPTPVIQKSERKSIKEQADEIFEIRSIRVILVLCVMLTLILTTFQKIQTLVLKSKKKSQ